MTSTDFHVEAIYRLCFVCGSIKMKNGHHILLVLKEATSLTSERSINLLKSETSSHVTVVAHRGVRYSEVSAIQRCPLFRGVRYSEVSAIQRFCTNFCRSKKMCPLFGGANCKLLWLKPFTSV